MTLQKADFHKKSIMKVKNLWHLYILGEEPELLEEAFSKLPENLLMIGTGQREFYKTSSDFFHGMSEDQIEARDIQLELQDEWYEIQDISDTVCVVFGCIWAREKTLPGRTSYVDMEGSRFSIICREVKDDVEICSIHHSMPYIDQGTDEYYPKTLSGLAKEMEKRMEQDRMTELYSRYYMEQYVTKELLKSDGYFLVLDLDDFKMINDTKGHLVGDKVIQEFARYLRKIASPGAIIGRMGGDEFAVWDAKIQSIQEAEAKFNSLLVACETMAAKLGTQVSCSAGIVFSKKGCDNFSALYQKADQALYQAKSFGKSRLFSIAE